MHRLSLRLLLLAACLPPREQAGADAAASRSSLPAGAAGHEPVIYGVGADGRMVGG